MNKIINCFMLAVLVLFAVVLNSHAEKLTLKAVTLEYAPSAFIDENGQPAGIHVDIAKEAFARMGIKYEISFLPWKRALKLVYEGKADCIIDPAYNEERGKYCYFPKEPSHTDQWCLFKKKGNNIFIDDDLKNISHITIGIVDSYEYGGRLQAALKEKLFKRIDRVAGNLLFKMVLNKRVDIVPGEKSNIFYNAKKAGVIDEIVVVKSNKTGNDLIISNSPTYVAFSKKTVNIELVNKFSDIIIEMKIDGTYDAIKGKYVK